jgi:hypothetical protein
MISSRTRTTGTRTTVCATNFEYLYLWSRESGAGEESNKFSRINTDDQFESRLNLSSIPSIDHDENPSSHQGHRNITRSHNNTK